MHVEYVISGQTDGHLCITFFAGKKCCKNSKQMVFETFDKVMRQLYHHSIIGEMVG